MANWASTSDPRLPGVSLLTVYSESDRHPSRIKSPPQLSPSSGLSPPYSCEDGMSDREHIENQYPWSPYTPISTGSLVSRSSSPWYDDTASAGREGDINMCSDFTCCGLSLIDLHSLVDHFEEAHVVVFNSAGNAVYPNPSPILRIVDHEKEGPYMSFVLGYPAPTAPVAFLGLDTGSESALDLPSPSTPSEPMSAVEMNPEEELRYIPPMEASQPTLPVVRNGKREHRSRQRRKDKTKTYKCPHPDCTKMYLNANGLKYHLEKGTCKTELPMGRGERHGT